MTETNGNALVLSLDLKEVPVIFTSKGTEIHATLRELTGTTRDKYLDQTSKNAIRDKNGVPTGIKRMEGIQSNFITLCLFNDDGNIPPEEIQTYPSKTIQSLYDAAMELNGLNEKGEEAAKNE